MAPVFRPRLVNGRFGDPAVLVDVPAGGRALLLDLGSLHALPARDLLRVDLALVSHAHLDHLIGFDTLLRGMVGQERRLAVLGPEGIAARLGHKLAGYAWDLGPSYAAELAIEVTEIAADLARRITRFRLRNGFAAEPAGGSPPPPDGVVLRPGGFGVELAVHAAPLRHHGTPCLGYALRSPARANVDPAALAASGLRPGPWLQALKRALAEGRPDGHPIPIGRQAGEGGAEETRPLGRLRPLVRHGGGEALGYCTDLADTPSNRAAAAALVRGVDLLFIESAFAAAEADRAARRGHLSTLAAGAIAREAGVGRVQPFHFSARHAGQERAMLAELAQAFGGPVGDPEEGGPERDQAENGAAETAPEPPGP